MDPWLFFASFAVLLAVREFVSRKVVATTLPLLPPEERTLTPRRRALVRVVEASWWAVIVAATIGWWFGSDVASGVLGIAFAVTALSVVIGGLSWLTNRTRGDKRADGTAP